MGTIDKEEQLDINLLKKIAQGLSDLIPYRSDNKLVEEAGKDVQNAEEFLEEAEVIESNLGDQGFVKRNFKNNTDLAKEAIDKKLKLATNHLVRAERILEDVEGGSEELQRIEELTGKAEKLADKIDADIEMKEHSNVY